MKMNKTKSFLKVQSGMTLIQTIVLIALLAIIIVLVLPPLIEERKVSQAVSDVEMIADACKEYFENNGTYPCEDAEKIENYLCEDSKGENYRCEYLLEVFKNKNEEKYLDEIPKHPWGGNYVINPKKGKIGIAKEDEKVPEKYRLGGIAEISKVYKKGASWW